jgi:chemotaxis protein methyltransferase CheR
MRAAPDEALARAAVEVLATPETCFFRDQVPFDQLRDDVLPELAASRAEGRVRIWSAGCSTGQEAYSLAMLIEENEPRFSNLQVEILATDLSVWALEKAQSGLYTQFEVQRGLPIRLLVRHFEKADEMWSLSARIRQMVRWRRINLLADLRALGQFDIIFCRNVLSSFDEPTRRRVLEQLARALPADGCLVLGLEETVAGLTDALRPVAGHRGLYAPSPAAHADA